MSQTIPKERVRIFDRQGLPLVEFRSHVSRSWAIGKEGRASLSYSSRKTDIVNEENFQFGNYLLVENSLLPPWVGVIDTPRVWTNQDVEVNAYTAERLFSFRRGGTENKITGSAGSLFFQMIQIINSAEPTILTPNNIWYGGSLREETLTPSTLDKNLRQLQERSLEEYHFTPRTSSGKLEILADWTFRLGNYTPLTLLSAPKGGNLEAPQMTEDDEIINDVFGYGDGMTWASRVTANTVEPDSIAKYGLRQQGYGWNGVTQLATIQANNNDVITDKRNPRRVFTLQALNIDETFRYINIGNIVKLQVKSLGFLQNITGVDTYIRILGMSYNPENRNKVKIVAEEI